RQPRRGELLSRHFHFDRSRPDIHRLGHVHVQHAVLEFGGDAPHFHFGRQQEPADELAVSPLHPVGCLSLFFFFELPFPLDRQHTFVEVHFHFFFLDIRQIGCDDVLGFGLLDVTRRRPVPERQPFSFRGARESIHAPFHLRTLTQWVPYDD